MVDYSSARGVFRIRRGVRMGKELIEYQRGGTWKMEPILIAAYQETFQLFKEGQSCGWTSPL